MKNKALVFSSGFVSAILFVIVGFGIFFPQITNNIDLLQYYNFVLENYEGEIDSKTFKEEVYADIAENLNDQHSTYFTEEESAYFLSLLSTTNTGFGFVYTEVNNEFKLTEVIKGSSAFESGVYAGDVIKSINGNSTTNKSMDEVTNLLKDSTSEFVFYRPSTNSEYTLKLSKKEYFMPSVVSNFFEYEEQKVGYIHILSFSDTTPKDFKTILEEFENKGMTKLLIDVSDNGGGEVNSVKDISDLIVNNTKPYLYIKKKGKVEEEYKSSLKEPKPYSIIGIQNKNSASASEILMAAIKEVNGNIIVGQKSYGKGSVQALIPLENPMGSLKITTNKWFTADDNSIDKNGIEPNVNIDTDYPLFMDIILYSDVQLNSKGNLSLYINKYLNMIGYNTDDNSDVYSQSSKNEFNRFQADNNLPVGNVDVQSIRVLNEKAKVKHMTPNYNLYIKEAVSQK